MKVLIEEINEKLENIITVKPESFSLYYISIVKKAAFIKILFLVKIYNIEIKLSITIIN